MKKNVCLVLITAALLALLGCGQTARQTPPEPVNTTLMVYMIGSDLEAKAGAATADLEEMLQSGVDLTHHKVVVCAGGAPYWHNTVADVEQRTVLQLTQTGFQQAASFDSASMGESRCLTEFLNYAVENFPSERYALILWNHGNGPLMGYGKDMLYKNDSLLLEEMKQAMEDSAFGPENKLSWVGFDACLMASAELSCLWADYADYLVASQEVEPSFGWSYGFLEDLGSHDIPALMTRLTGDYLAACEAYFAERGFENRDATLACVDLSCAGELKNALNALFNRALLQADGDYNELVSRRVQTRALGRSSTGSEYDLIDLKDLAVQMQTLYPEETAAVLAVVEEMVVANATNTAGCCGMSLYFPFYNKYYYEADWQKTYSRLDSFESYTQYLEAYEKKWLNPEIVSAFSSSFVPSVKEGAYTLTLTPEQQQSYASARYYVLRRESEQMYNYLFISSDVSREGDTLTANFDGKIIYVKDRYENYHIPVSVELEKIGDLAHYTVPFSVTSGAMGQNDTEVVGLLYHLGLQTKTGQVSVGALLRGAETFDEATLMGGKVEDEDLSAWYSAVFWEREHMYLTRDENGAILPLDQWHQNSWFTAMEYYCADDIQFVYEPLDAGEYYLMLEVQDTYGNRYCSELLPVNVPGHEKPVYQMPQTTLTWNAGDHALLAQENGVELYLTCVEVQGKVKYTLEVRNQNDFPVELQAKNFLCNDNIICWESEEGNSRYMGSLTAKPGQTNWFMSWADLGMAEAAGDLSQLRNMCFTVEIRNRESGELLLPWHQFQVELSAEMSDYLSSRQNRIPFAAEPLSGARAQKQCLFEDHRVCVTLLGFGTDPEDSWSMPHYVLRVENKTNEEQTVGLGGIAFNGVFTECNEKISLPANYTGYISGRISSSDLFNGGITDINTVDMLVQLVQKSTFFSGFSEPHWCSVTLSEASDSAEPFREGSRVIFQKEGVRIAIEEMEVNSLGDPCWAMTVYNESQENISVILRNVMCNGAPCPSDVYVRVEGGKAGAGQFGFGKLCADKDGGEQYELSFVIQLMDVNEEYVIYTDTDIITLPVQMPS